MRVIFMLSGAAAARMAMFCCKVVAP
jgi:hypothetical protein